MTTVSRARAFVAVLFTGALLAVLCAAPAQAAGYRYWSFWEQDAGSWAYATEGPSTARPDDGSVHGFRFSVSADAQDAAKPRGEADFAKICADTPARDGSKRIALVLDFGTSADAPDGETPPERRTACARTEQDATGAEALAAVAKPLRYDSSAMLCAIHGYPKSGCGESVSGSGTSGASDAPESSAPSAPSAVDNDGSGGPSVGLIAGVAAVVVLGAAGLWQARRRRG